METLPHEVVAVSRQEIEPFLQGRRVGCYLLGKTLGEGSFAKVKEGIHIITGEKVAVKIIDKKRAREDRYISKNLRREARILQLVRHANIVQLFEVLETDNYYYLVMEHCSGGELLDYICTRKRLEENTARRLVSQLVSAVDAMHRNAIVHRDLKIENFLLNENEDLKIIDFGLSNTLPSQSMDEYERTGVFPQLLNTHCGSPAYAAPELLAQKQYGPQVDVWSIGINMYAMLTGFLPYMMEPFNVMEMYEKMMQRKMTPVPNFLSKECRDLLMRLLEPVPEWRISLKQVMRHSWFTGTSHIPRSISLGDMMYTKKELCESVLKYMKYSLKIKTKDAINAIVSNRAVHASAIYHLLVLRLDRHLKEKKDIDIQTQHFPKVEVIKKASLVLNEKNTNVTTQKTKKFSFRGKKIDTSRSQSTLTQEINNNTISPNESRDEMKRNEIHSFTNDIKKRESENNSRNSLNNNNNNNDNDETDGNRENKIVNNRTSELNKSKTTRSNVENSKSKKSSELNIENVNKPLSEINNNEKTNDKNKSKVRRHKRSATADAVCILADVNQAIKNTLKCESQEDIKVEPLATTTTPTKKQPSVKPPDTPEGELVTTRKMSCDCNGLEKYFIKDEEVKNETPSTIDNKVATSSCNNTQVETAVITTGEDNAETTEENVKEQKEACPGWMITKIIKQPPLKDEDTIRDIVHKVTSPATDKQLEKTPKVVPVKTLNRFDKKLSSDNLSHSPIRRSVTPNASRAIKRPQTPEKLKEELHASASDVKDETSRDTPTPELREIMNNIRKINKSHQITDIDRLLSTPENAGSWKAPDKETMTSIHDSKARQNRVYSLPSSDSPKEYKPRKRISDSFLPDQNNNSSVARKRYDTPPQGFVRERMKRLRSLEQDSNDNRVSSPESCNPPFQTTNDSDMKSIKSPVKMEEQETTEKSSRTLINIIPAKKTLELNVRQFKQFSVKPGQNGVVPPPRTNKVTSPLKPLEINLNFKMHRKKKAYNQKQQTRSLTDVTKANATEKPTEKQILSPKNKYNEEQIDMSRQLDQDQELSHQSFHDIDLLNMATDNNIKITQRTTISISARKPTKIYIKSTSSTNAMDDTSNELQFNEDPKIANKVIVTRTKSDTCKPHNDDMIEKLEAKYLKDDDGMSYVQDIKKLRKKFEQSSFDSGFFGNNNSTDEENIPTSPCLEYESPRKTKTIERQNQDYQQSAKYRCHPVYKPELTTTGQMYDASSPRLLSPEPLSPTSPHPRVWSPGASSDRSSGSSESSYYNSPLNKRWGSQDLEPTQEKPLFIPRSAEIKRNILAKSKLENTSPIKNNNDTSQKIVRSKSSKQYPIQRTVVGSASPKFQRTASFGMTRNTRLNLPTQTSTIYDTNAEKNKIFAFTQALGAAAFRRKSANGSLV